MNDPWDVKSVRQSDQYVSCMKINGVPLLPPLLSKECRKEMEYYKLLAKEVEKRISILKPYVGSDWDSSEDRIDAPELAECEQTHDKPLGGLTDSNGTGPTTGSSVELNCINLEPSKPHVTTERYKNITSNVTVKTADANLVDSTNIHIDLSLSISEKTGRNEMVTTQNTSQNCEPPERDRDYTKKEKEIEIERLCKNTETVKDFDLNVDSNIDPFVDLPFPSDGPSSLSSKSFTGSLYDIHKESMKESQFAPPLIRQSSYTVLKPSPQLLAHLEVQSLNTGVEMSAISMSESLSNLYSPNKKRRSWDLETAKVKWSSMAMELKGANVKMSNGSIDHVTRSTARKSPQTSPPRTRSVAVDKTSRASLMNNKTIPKSEPVTKPNNSPSQIKNVVSRQPVVKEQSANSNRQITMKEPVSPPRRFNTSPKITPQSKDHPSPKNVSLISNSDDPATKVRELYEKIQNQQLIQMANLVEKQKKEQMLLQQVFEEQNTILFKQLKTICPKSPIEVKMAWGDKTDDVDRGPVSLSQLINHKSPETTMSHSPVSNTLTETNNCLNHCDNILKKSRDITGSIKRQQNSSKPNRSQDRPMQRPEANKTRTNSPIRNTSRKLDYDSNVSDREYEPILTDRTNDTFADLNVTFPSDSDDFQAYQTNTPIYREMSVKQLMVSPSGSQCRSADRSIRCLEDSIQHSMNAVSVSRTVKPGCHHRPPTTQEREAATKIVAHAKGWLVRRLMKTERVQATVQTIRDALLCALQLHQDREGIRGADVDLHRRLIQQITAACYSLHDTFVASTPAERCAIIASDRGRRRSIASRQPTPRSVRHTDIMSQSHSGSFPTRHKRSSSASLMTQSNYETFNGDKSPVARARYMPSPRRRPWR